VGASGGAGSSVAPQAVRIRGITKTANTKKCIHFLLIFVFSSTFYWICSD
jgi:hypothetical protein